MHSPASAPCLEELVGGEQQVVPNRTGLVQSLQRTQVAFLELVAHGPILLRGQKDRLSLLLRRLPGDDQAAERTARTELRFRRRYFGQCQVRAAAEEHLPEAAFGAELDGQADARFDGGLLQRCRSFYRGNPTVNQEAGREERVVADRAGLVGSLAVL